MLDDIVVREVRDVADRLNQIGSALGLTAERARQIEVAALNKLREALAQPAPAGVGVPLDPRLMPVGRMATPVG